MWNRRVDGRELHFRLGGINNQNFLMYDEETGSWWQQVTGKCLWGPLKGKHLERIDSDEVTLATWRTEHPESLAVRFDSKYLKEYAPSDWEARVGGYSVTVPVDGSPLPARELVVGVEIEGKALAVPLRLLREQSPVNTQLGTRPLLVLMGADGKSVRTFFREVDGKAIEFFRKPGDGELELIDASGSAWNFTGRAVGGEMQGRTLRRVQNITEYWFDWKLHHPSTRLYRAGESIRKNRAVSSQR